MIRRFVNNRDEAAFRVIVERYSKLVLSVALRTVHDRPAAEDVLQATFLVLIEKADSLDDASQLAAWLHGVAQRIARRLVDKRHRHREQPHPQESVIMDPGASTDPFERLSETRDHDVLGEELQRLPAKYRTPLVLRYLEDLTNEQVAERLGMQVSTVEGRLKRGKKELRRRLARRGVTLGAAMLVWNMTQQSLQAAPIAELVDRVASTVLAWQSPTPAASPPTEPAITLAQQEIVSMSTLKLTAAGTLAGTALLATGLIVAIAGANEEIATAAGKSIAGESTIVTSVSSETGSTDTADLTAPLASTTDDTSLGNGSVAPVASKEEGLHAPFRLYGSIRGQIWKLNHVKAETAVELLDAMISEDGRSIAGVRSEGSLVLSFDARDNSVIAAGDEKKLDIVEKMLLKLDQQMNPGADPFDTAPMRPRPAQSARPTASRVFKLKHAIAEDAAELLQRWYGTEVAQAPDETVEVIDELGLTISRRHAPTFIADPQSNTVLVTATAEVLASAQRVLDAFDNDEAPSISTKASPSRVEITMRQPAEEKLRQALQTTTVPAFDDLPLYNAIFILAEKHGFQFVVDEAALEAAGISIHEAPVTLNLANSPSLRDDVTVESVLELLFRQATESDGDFNDSALTYLIKDGLLVITTRDVAGQTMELRTYDLRPFAEKSGQFADGGLAQAIMTMTGDVTWAEQGGRGSIVKGVDTLTIRQSPLIHREIEQLLEHFLHVAKRAGDPSY